MVSIEFVRVSTTLTFLGIKFCDKKCLGMIDGGKVLTLLY